MKHQSKSGNNLSSRERAELKREVIAELVAQCESGEDLFGPEGVFTRLKGAVMEELLEAELSAHLGRDNDQQGAGGNSRGVSEILCKLTWAGDLAGVTNETSKQVRKQSQ